VVWAGRETEDRRRVDLGNAVARGHPRGMVWLIIGMLLCVGLALAVVAIVAIPARREGRDLLTPQGEELVALVKEKTESTIEKTGDVLSATKDKVAESMPGPLGDSSEDTASPRTP
jgi:hypothetical protein